MIVIGNLQTVACGSGKGLCSGPGLAHGRPVGHFALIRKYRIPCPTNRVRGNPSARSRAFESTAMTESSLLAIARGEAPADLVLRNGKVVNVFTCEVEEVDVALAGEFIAGVGETYDGISTLDLDGKYLLPGFIDAHVHVESSLTIPAQFARAVVPSGRD